MGPSSQAETLSFARLDGYAGFVGGGGFKVSGYQIGLQWCILMAYSHVAMEPPKTRMSIDGLGGAYPRVLVG